ncbi:MAG TPA: polyphosphate kinase 1 [Vicinamibacterales bacterium]|nr:polyphosphate kinase 1 [Vicinamibacterales bacterium]
MTPRGPLAAAHAASQNSTRRRARRPLAPPLVVVPSRDISPTDLRNPGLYVNRELSWLEFNERVLDQARDAAHPLLERVKFLAITASNLDEFFMIRVSTTLKKLNAGADDVGPDGLNTEQQLSNMLARARRMLRDQAEVWTDLRRLLESAGIRVLDRGDWSPETATHLAGVFTRDIAPVLTPLAFDPGRPLPFLGNRSMNVAVTVAYQGRTRYARVSVPAVLPRFIALPESLHPGSPQGQALVMLEDVVCANIDALFLGGTVEGAHLFRVVRDADLELDQADAEDLLQTVEGRLKQLRHGPVSMLQLDGDMPVRMRQVLIEALAVSPDEVVQLPGRLGLSDWVQLTRLHRPELKDAPFAARSLWRREEDPTVIFDRIRDDDLLVHHPYESFATVETFVHAAAVDPHVAAIKMTLYRIGAQSPLLDLLIQAAESGKQVAVLVEIKARLDERNNILWARRLEAHGIHVVYGFADLKTHAKLCLVVRQESDGIRRYVHTSTGNYNVETARAYTDLGLFTADPGVAADVSAIFNSLTGYSTQNEFNRLVVAPRHLRKTLKTLVDREAAHARAGRPAHIVIKVNAITDDGMIRALYRASQAGVTIDLLVRGICSLRPGVPGISERIRVRSIVGRFLEHSRIYWFANGGAEEMFIGSADVMERNLGRRVETLIPIREERILRHLRDVVLDAYLKDTDRAMALDASGAYTHVTPGPEGRFNAQEFLLRFYTRERG